MTFNNNNKPPIDISKNPFLHNKAVDPKKIATIRKGIIQFQTYIKMMRLTETELTMVQELLMALILGIAPDYKANVEDRHKFSTRMMEIITREIKK